jgi:N-acetylmuramoyl-L-alanine amidase
VASNRSLREGSQQFKGETNIDNYQEDNMFKYTIGASADYNEIYRLRKTLLGKFPEAFIVAFKDGNRMNINQAIAEFKSNRNKK